MPTMPGFCKSATLEEIRSHGHVLTPGRYVGAAAVEEDEAPFAERFAALQQAGGAVRRGGESDRDRSAKALWGGCSMADGEWSV